MHDSSAAAADKADGGQPGRHVACRTFLLLLAVLRPQTPWTALLRLLPRLLQLACAPLTQP